MKNLKAKMCSLKDRLLRVSEEEPLSKLSFVVILILDLFILTMIFGGLDDHTRQLTSPHEYIPYECQEAFIRNTWKGERFLSELQRLVLSDYRNYYYRYESPLNQERLKQMHPLCRDFFSVLKKISEQKDLKDKFLQRKKLQEKRVSLKKHFKQSKDVYDTTLLESIAKQRPQEEALPTISTSMKKDSKKIDQVTGQLQKLEEEILAHPLVKELLQVIRPSREQRQKIIDDFKRQQFWYPLKELAWQLLFLLPLFFIFYFWSSRSVKNGHSVQTLISSHLLVISTIPIFFKAIELILDLIPQHFFRNLFRLLKSLHLMAIWHYIVIFGSIGAGLFIIYLIQKKIFNIHRIHQKRLMNGACFHCGKKLPQLSSHCPFCGTHQKMNCESCGEETFRGAPYCQHCGTAPH